MTTAREALEGVSFLQRGWLSSNNVLLHGAPGEGATLVDSGHCAHAEQTVALVRHALSRNEGPLPSSSTPRGGGPGHGPALGALSSAPLARLVNTHLHSDHCGGNGALQRAFPATSTLIPPGLWEAVQRWDEDALSYRPTRQRCVRFGADATLAPGSTLRCGGRAWEVLAAPGHDPDSVMLFDAAHGVLISADALWENGFGVVFPELEGAAAYDDVAAVLALIERLPVQWVLPGHGAPFTDVAGALGRARSRLAGFRADPARHDRHAAKVLLKFHMLEERAQPLPELCAWLAAAPLMRGMWQRLGRPGASIEGWCDALVAELCAAGVLAQRDGVVYDR